MFPLLFIPFVSEIWIICSGKFHFIVFISTCFATTNWISPSKCINISEYCCTFIIMAFPKLFVIMIKLIYLRQY